MRNVPKRRMAREALAVALTAAALALPMGARAASADAHFVTLPTQRRVPAVPRTARALGHLEAGASVPLSISLPLRDEAGLQDLLKRLYDPADPLYHQFVSQPEFAKRFGPTQADYNAVIAFAQAHGMAVTHQSPTRSVLDVVGTREAVEAAFGTTLTKYQMASGRIAYSNNAPPHIPAALAYKISGVVGLSTVNLHQYSHRRPLTGEALRPLIQAAVPHAEIGTGPQGGLTPADIKTIYSLAGIAPANLTGLTGQGQTLGLYELDGYLPSDIAGYTTQYNLPTANLTNVLFNNFAGTAGVDTGEVVLDIDMMVALAPKANIVVYETANGTSAASSLYQKMADDNLAKSISTSFGFVEAKATDGGVIPTETHAFQQMQAQGQSFFAAAGDNGAYDDGTTISVDDPAANPAVTGVGGTSLTVKPTTEAYVSETTWNNGSASVGAGGGGVSTLFALPSYQIGITTVASKSFRNVPDVSLNADPETGYSTFVTQPGGTAGFEVVGGTSAAAPLWAAFTGLVNEQRSDFGQKSTVGFINPALYALAQTSQYTTVFHDIADGSTNLKYVAVAGYDNATGLGTFVGDQLLAALAPSTNTPVTVNGTVLDSSGKPVSGAAVTVSTLQIANFARIPAVDASGAFTVTLDSLLAADPTTGSSKPITYTFSADAPGFAGQTLSVTPAQTQQVALTLSTPQYTFAPNVLQMVSTPYEYAGAGDFATLFGLTLPLSGTGHNLVVWSPLSSAYVYYPSAPADTFHLGQGYWTALPTNAYIRRIGTLAPSGPFRISLQQGWNQIGDPFPRNVTLSSIQVSLPATPGAPTPASSPIGQSSLVTVPLYAYPPGAGAYTTLGVNDQIQPWLGYWIYANQPAVLTVPGP